MASVVRIAFAPIVALDVKRIVPLGSNFAEESLRGDASFRKNEGVKVARNGLLKLGHPLTI